MDRNEDTRRTATAVRRRDGNLGGFVAEKAHVAEMTPTTAARVEPQRVEEGAMKRFLKSVFLNVSGDINEIG